MLCCCHVQLGWFAHGAGQLVDGVSGVAACALAQEHQRTRDRLVKLDARRI